MSTAMTLSTLRPSRLRFDGLVAWITGAGTGIGRACAIALAERGAHVVLSGRREGPLLLTADACRARGVTAVIALADVTDEATLQGAVDTALEAFGRLDLVLANAGCSVSGRVEELTTEEWRRQLDINVIGVASTVKVALPALRASGGRIGLVGSVMAYLGLPGSAAYAASKAAVRAIGDSLHLELHGTGVSCTLIQPGFVESDIARTDNTGAVNLHRKDYRPSAVMWSGERAAEVIVDALHKRQRELVFTGHGRFATWLARHAPGLMYSLLGGPLASAVGAGDRPLAR
jgi:NAD(P)-dependent dehydrogenase (short-subunit alcohol dehydrogenase family)